MATYLVTGVAGFIAARTAELLLAEGHRVVGVDNLNDYYDIRLKDHRLGRLLGRSDWRAGAESNHSRHADAGRQATVDGRFVFEPVDVEDLRGLERLFAEFKFTAVFNLAARAGVRYSLENPHIYLTTNAHGTLNLLECQRKFGVRKQVLASTSSLYAGCPLPFREDAPVNTPLSPYAASKKAAEAMAFSYTKMHNLDVTVARYFTVFGPSGRPDMSIFRFIQWILAGRPLEVTGDGTQGRDFTYVDDIARGTILAAKPVGYEIVNLGGGRPPCSLRETIAALETELGKKAQITEKPKAAADIEASQADVAKAEWLLGWKPEVSFAEGLRRTVRWHLENQDWLREVRL
jgi:nucleoside-diphosphate-sugar epimerase